MNFPLKSDINWIKSLKKGDFVYFAEGNWNPETSKMEIIVKSLIFDSFDTSRKTVWDENNPVIFGILSNGSGSIKTEPHNLCYGFAPSPLDALDSLKKLYTISLDAINDAIKSENKRIKKSVEKMIKK